MHFFTSHLPPFFLSFFLSFHFQVELNYPYLSLVPNLDDTRMWRMNILNALSHARNLFQSGKLVFKQKGIPFLSLPFTHPIRHLKFQDFRFIAKGKFAHLFTNPLSLKIAHKRLLFRRFHSLFVFCYQPNRTSNTCSLKA